MGLLLSAFSWPYAIANLPAGYLVDKFGAKEMFAWAAACGRSSPCSPRSSVVSRCSTRCGSPLGITESPFFTSGLKVAAAVVRQR